MKLITKEISEQLQKQYAMGSNMDQLVMVKLFDASGSWSWYVMNQDPEDPSYLWGIVQGNELEIGSFSLAELESYKGRLGIGIERDIYFKPVKAGDLWKRLQKGEHI